MAYCPGCGEEINPGAPFCNNCGRSIDEPAASQSQPRAPQQVAAPQPRKAAQAIASMPTQPTPAVAPIQTRAERVPPPFNPILWIVGVVVLAVVTAGIYISQNKKSEPAPEAVTPVAATSVPVIVSLTADQPSQDNGTWSTVVHWKVTDAERASLDIGDRQHLEANLGSSSQTVTLDPGWNPIKLTAFNKAGVSTTQDIKVKAVAAASLDSTASSTSDNAPPAPDSSTLQIVKFQADLQTDTSIGSAFRLSYTLPPSADAHLLVNGKEFYFDATAPYGDYFVTRKGHFVLTVKTSTGEITKELDLTPDPKIAPEPERQETGPSLADTTDVVSWLAAVSDFSTAADRAARDPLSGWLSGVLQKASYQDLNRYDNGVYARHGYIFHVRQDLKDYFEKRSWYVGNTTSMEVAYDRFNALEKANTKWLLAREKAAKP